MRGGAGALMEDVRVGGGASEEEERVGGRASSLMRVAGR